jgi:hypothetical protein
LSDLGAELKSRQEIFPPQAVRLVSMLLAARGGAKAGAVVGTILVPEPGSVAGAAVGVAVGVTASAFISDLQEARVEAGPVQRFMAKSKDCDKLARQESAELRAQGANAISSAPQQIFVITRQFGVFALYPYTIARPTALGDYVITTYGRNPRDPITVRFGRP